MILFQVRTCVFLIGFLCWAEVTSLSQDQADPPKPIDFKITGQVTDELEKPIRGAKASLGFDFKEKSISVVTDEFGNFEIIYPAKIAGKAFPSRDLYLWVQASGYNLKCVRPQMESKQFLPCQVLLNEEDHIVLVVHDADGEPCPEAIVEPVYFDVPNGVYYSEQSTGLVSIPPKDVAESFRVTTDKNGEAEFRGIPIRKFEGAYCNARGMVPQLFRFKGDGTLTFKLRPTGKVRGKVVCNETDIPNPDWTGRKVSIVSYERPSADKNNRLNRFAQDFFNRVQSHQWVELNRDGCFELDGVISGDVTVRLDEGDSELQPIPKQHKTLEADGVLELEIEVAKAVPVYGTLLTEDTREPLASVRISIYTPGNSPEYRLGTTSDTNGKFKLYLHPGEYTVQPVDTSESKQANDYSYPPTAHVSVTSKMDDYKIPDILFPPLQREAGKLIDANGKALPNRRVALISMNSNHPIKYGVSDNDGKLDIRFDQRRAIVRQPNTRWVLYPKNSKSIDGDVRQFPTLTLQEESPLVLMLLSDE